VSFVDEWVDQSFNDLLSKEDAKTDIRSVSDIIKEYPEMFKIVIYHDSYNLPNPSASSGRREIEKKYREQDNIDRSLRRSQQAVKDIILCNEWSLWCTFTFDKKYVDRYDFNACQRKMSRWFNRQPNLRYIAVPEHHKDGAIHFHALIDNYQGVLKDTGFKTKKGATIYKGNYGGGFCKFIKIDENKEQIANYMLKQYMTKDMIKIYNRKRYTTSRNLVHPIHHVNGLSMFKLKNFVIGKKPHYINDMFEVHYVYKGSTQGILSRDTQLSFSTV
jgi:hypothetical protein